MSKKKKRQPGIVKQPGVDRSKVIDPAQSRMMQIIDKKGPHSIIPDIGDSMSVVPGYEMQMRTAGTASVIRRASESNEDVEQLFREYMQKLVDEKLMLRLRDIKKMNILDITSFAALPDDGYTIPKIPDATMEEREAIERLSWYSFVPCFEKGAVKMNAFRYVVFEVREINPEEKSVTMRLYDYMRINGTWQTGVATTVKAEDLREFNENDSGLTKHYVVIKHFEDQDFEDLYTMYDPKELGWSQERWKFWNDVIVKNSKNVSDKLKNEYNTSQCEQLANLFLKIISRCNAMLEMNKPSRPIKKSGASTGKRTVNYEKGAAPERKIRTVGILKVQSEKVPRKPCMETVITYKTAQWNVRGFPRTYPSGKTVYIKPGVRHRKALANTDEATATTIRFKKKIQKAPEEGQ